MWQELIVGACVLLAIVFLLRQWWPFAHNKKSGCDNCSDSCRNKKP